jgi:uncharacterized protein (DUF2147 family)
MKASFAVVLGFIFMVLVSPVSASDMDDMVGTWSWEGYTIEVVRCEATGVCATVTAGPSNVGMEMIKSKPMQKDYAFVGKVAHPVTGEIYDSKIIMAGSNSWHLNGCTSSGACASGDFIRVK